MKRHTNDRKFEIEKEEGDHKRPLIPVPASQYREKKVYMISMALLECMLSELTTAGLIAKAMEGKRKGVPLITPAQLCIIVHCEMKASSHGWRQQKRSKNDGWWGKKSQTKEKERKKGRGRSGAHTKCILFISSALPYTQVPVILSYPSKYTIPEVFVHLDRECVVAPDVEVDEKA